MEQEKNGAIEIGNLMADMMRPGGSPEAEILETAGKFTFQLRLDQQAVLNKLAMAAHHPYMSVDGKRQIEAFIPIYTESKRHNDTQKYITEVIMATSLKKFMDNKNIQGQIIKTGQ